MKTRFLFLTLVVWLVATVTGRAAVGTQPPGSGGGSGGGVSVTNGYSFNGPFSTVNGTNVYLNAGISNLVLNPAFTNANQVKSNIIVVQASTDALANGTALTNAVKTAGTLASASRPMLVWVTPGKYWTPTNTLPSVMMAVDNVSTYWEPGAVWMSGKSVSGSDTAFMWDDSAGKRTNVNVYGYGQFYLTNNNAAVVSLENGSRMRFFAQDVYASDGTNGSGGGASTFNFLTTAADFEAEVNDTIFCDTYDAFYFSAAEGHKVKIKARKIGSKFGDILETTGSAANWGDVMIEAEVMERTATTGETWLGNTYIPQPSFMKIGGKVSVKAKAINVYSTNGVIYSGSTTNYGLLSDAVVTVATNSWTGVIGDGSGTGSAQSGVYLKNVTINGPTGRDALLLTNLSALPTILENVTINSGPGATNWARGVTPSKVLILGGLALNPYLPYAANITVVGTNTSVATDIRGTLAASGLATFSAGASITGGNLTVRDNDIDNNQSIYTDSMFITNVLYLPLKVNGTAADGRGALIQESNSWATARDTLRFNDGTADVKVVAALASDTPSNGQVPTWNTGGTITWETPSGGSGSSNMVTAEIGRLNITNGISMTGAGSASLHALMSYQSDAFALTRATNSPATTGTTNDFQISQSAKPADGLRLLSTSAGQNVWTNGPIVLTVTDTNQTSINVDCALPYTHYIVTTSRTNFDVAFSNTYAVRVGREIIVEFPTNLVTTSVQVTNKDAQTVRWNRGFTTNGAPSVVKTNINNLTLLFSFPTTNHPIVDAANY